MGQVLYYTQNSKEKGHRPSRSHELERIELRDEQMGKQITTSQCVHVVVLTGKQVSYDNMLQCKNAVEVAQHEGRLNLIKGTWRHQSKISRNSDA